MYYANGETHLIKSTQYICKEQYLKDKRICLNLLSQRPILMNENKKSTNQIIYCTDEAKSH